MVPVYRKGSRVCYPGAMVCRLVVSLVLLFLPVGLGAWEPADYENIPGEEFFLRPEVTARIDLNRIDQSLLNAALFYQTNRERTAAGLAPFRHLEALEKSSFGHARQMVDLNFFSHESPDKTRRTLSDRLVLVGIRLGYRAENIARGFGLEYESGRAVFPPYKTHGGFRYTLEGPDLLPRTYEGLAKSLVDQWMASADHRANILNPDLKYLGCAAVVYKAVNFYQMDYVMAVQDFSSYSGEP